MHSAETTAHADPTDQPERDANPEAAHPRPTPFSMAQTAMGCIVQVLTDRPGTDEHHQRVWTADIWGIVSGLRPMDPLEVMLIGQILLFSELTAEAALHAFHVEDIKLKLRARAQVASLNREMHRNLRALWKSRADHVKRADDTRETDPADLSAGAPAPRPPSAERNEPAPPVAVTPVRTSAPAPAADPRASVPANAAADDAAHGSATISANATLSALAGIPAHAPGTAPANTPATVTARAFTSASAHAPGTPPAGAKPGGPAGTKPDAPDSAPAKVPANAKPDAPGGQTPAAIAVTAGPDARDERLRQADALLSPRLPLSKAPFRESLLASGRS